MPRVSFQPILANARSWFEEMLTVLNEPRGRGEFRNGSCVKNAATRSDHSPRQGDALMISVIRRTSTRRGRRT
jgi:hypothetical protein